MDQESLHTRWNAFCEEERARYHRYMHVQTNLFEGVITVGKLIYVLSIAALTRASGDEDISNLTRVGFYSNAISHHQTSTSSDHELSLESHGEVSDCMTIVAILQDCEKVRQITYF